MPNDTAAEGAPVTSHAPAIVAAAHRFLNAVDAMPIIGDAKNGIKNDPLYPRAQTYRDLFDRANDLTESLRPTVMVEESGCRGGNEWYRKLDEALRRILLESYEVRYHYAHDANVETKLKIHWQPRDRQLHEMRRLGTIHGGRPETLQPLPEIAPNHLTFFRFALEHIERDAADPDTARISRTAGAIRAGRALLQMIENNPEMQKTADYLKAWGRSFSEIASTPEFQEAVRKGEEEHAEKLKAYCLPPINDFDEDFLRLARIAGMTDDEIGKSTPEEIERNVLDWAEAKMIELRMQKKIESEIEPPTAGKPEKRDLTTNERMIAAIQQDPSRNYWSVGQWSIYLGKSKSTIHGTLTWSALKVVHASMKIERASGGKKHGQRRRTKPKRPND